MSPLVTEIATTATSPSIDFVSVPYVGNTPGTETSMTVANDVEKAGRISLLVRRRRRRNRLLAH